MTPDRRTFLAAALAAGAAPAEAAVAAPRRVVSLNACLDVMLVHLADRAQITALSHYARQSHGSTIVPLALTLPYTWETAEEVVALRPDLVLASQHSSLPTRNALQRLGVRMEGFATPKSVSQSLGQVRKMAKLVGHPERGEALAAQIETALTAAQPPPGARPIPALMFQPNGFSAPPGTLVDEMMRRAGFENLARRYGLKTWGNVALERLLADPPALLLVGEAEPGTHSWAERVMTHPALASLKGRMRQARFPEELMYCGGPVIVEAANTLRRIREAFEAGTA